MRYHHNTKTFLTILSQNLWLFYPLSLRLLFLPFVHTSPSLVKSLMWIFTITSYCHWIVTSETGLLHPDKEESCDGWGIFCWLVRCFFFVFLVFFSCLFVFVLFILVVLLLFLVFIIFFFLGGVFVCLF